MQEATSKLCHSYLKEIIRLFDRSLNSSSCTHLLPLSLSRSLFQTDIMRFSTVFALLFASIAVAAPVDLAVREADAEAAAVPAPDAAPDAAAEADGYGSYGTYAPPAGGYGR
jgi:hypothetical protein